MYKLILLAAFVAVAFAWDKASHQYPEGAPSEHEEEVRTVLAHKQHLVNKQALYQGAGVGTAPYRGVPGTTLERRPYGYQGPVYGANFGYGYGYGYPYAAYPYGAYHGY